MPPDRALLTYWRHFLRRSPQSAASSARRSMIRVAFGWIGAAGRQPATRSARRRLPSGSSGPFASISGSIRTCETRPASRGRPSRTADVNASIAARGPGRGHGPARCVGEPPRHRPRPPDEDLSADRGVRPRLGEDPVGGPAVHGLDRRPLAALKVRTGLLGLDERVPRSCVGSRHDRTGRRNASTMTPTIDGSSGIRKAAETRA